MGPTSEEIQRIKEQFTIVDQDGSGLIEKEELDVLLSILGLVRTVDEEQPTWPEWSFIEEEFMNDLEHVEKDLEQDLKLSDYKEEESFTEGFQMVVTEEDMVERFDPTKTDMDDYWTMEDDFTHEIDLIDYKMDYNDLFENVDFIALKTSKVETFEIQAICELDLNYNAVLDLGADVSVVPTNMGSLGKSRGA
eukprot:g3199.t1